MLVSIALTIGISLIKEGYGGAMSAKFLRALVGVALVDELILLRTDTIWRVADSNTIIDININVI